MKKLMRCRVCGYVTESDKLGEVCPICNVASRAFEPLILGTATRTRLFIINLDIHAIVVHLSQSLAFIIPLMLILRYLFPSFNEFLSNETMYFIMLIYPPAVFASLVSGIFDGYFRLTNFKGKLPITKMIAGTLLLALSILMCYVSSAGDFGLWTILISLASLGVAIFLGMKGKILSHIIIPDNF
jgi:hypothetical protein